MPRICKVPGFIQVTLTPTPHTYSYIRHTCIQHTDTGRTQLAQESCKEEPMKGSGRGQSLERKWAGSQPGGVGVMSALKPGKKPLQRALGPLLCPTKSTAARRAKP